MSFRAKCLTASSAVMAVAFLSGCSLLSETEAEKGNVCGVTETSVTASGYAVSTSDARATNAACQVLSDGGSAADAVVVAQTVLGLVEPQSSGPGGGAIALYHEAGGDTVAYDATTHSASEGHGVKELRSAGIPQTMRLMRQLNDDHGNKDLTELTEAARGLAIDGFAVDKRLADAAQARKDDLKDTFLGVPEEGALLTNPDYAAYLADWAEGPMEADHLNVAALSPEFAEQWANDEHDDLSNEEPLCTDYRGKKVCGSPSTATGNMVVQEALGLLRETDINERQPYTNGGIPVAKTDAAQFISEAERIAFADGNTWMADENHDEKRAESYRDDLVSNEDYLKDRAKDIDQHRAMDTPDPGELSGFGERYRDFFEVGTTHISVVDADGNAASVTSTLQHNFGSAVQSNGFFLNNSLDNFTEGAEAGEPNARIPDAKPKTLMAPQLVFTDDELTAVLGSPGGSKIPSYVIKAIVGLVDWQLSPAEIVVMPNFGVNNRDGVYLEKVDTDQLEDMDRMEEVLEKRGHDLDVINAPSGLGIITTSGDRHLDSSGDPRRTGASQGGMGIQSNQ